MYGAREQEPALPIDNQRPVVVLDDGTFSSGKQHRGIEEERKGEEEENEGFSHGDRTESVISSTEKEGERGSECLSL